MAIGLPAEKRTWFVGYSVIRSNWNQRTGRHCIVSIHQGVHGIVHEHEWSSNATPSLTVHTSSSLITCKNHCENCKTARKKMNLPAWQTYTSTISWWYQWRKISGFLRRTTKSVSANSNSWYLQLDENIHSLTHFRNDKAVAPESRWLEWMKDMCTT